jgi:hypothetical protein
MVDEMDLDLDLDEIWEDSGLTDGEMDGGEGEWADGDTTFSEADMSIGSEVAALAEDGASGFLLACGFAYILPDDGVAANETFYDETTQDQK